MSMLYIIVVLMLNLIFADLDVDQRLIGALN